MTVGGAAPIVVLHQVPNSACGTLPSCPRRAKASWGGIHGIRSSVHSAAPRGNRVRRPLTHTSSDGHQKLPNHNGLSEIAHREEDRHLCTKCCADTENQCFVCLHAFERTPSGSLCSDRRQVCHSPEFGSNRRVSKHKYTTHGEEGPYASTDSLKNELVGDVVESPAPVGGASSPEHPPLSKPSYGGIDQSIAVVSSASANKVNSRNQVPDRFVHDEVKHEPRSDRRNPKQA